MNQQFFEALFLANFCFLSTIPIFNMIYHPKLKKFADDTMLNSVVDNPIISSRELNNDLANFRQNDYTWKLEFNPDSDKQATKMIFSCKRN